MNLIHPGEILKLEVVDGRGLSIKKAADLLGVTRTNLSNIFNGKVSISPNMALRVETVFGGSAKLWIRLQASYDLQEAKKVYMANPPKINHLEVA